MNNDIKVSDLCPLDSAPSVQEVVSSEELAKILCTRMDREVVHFVYQKSGGVPRPAIGTRSYDHIPNTRLTPGVVAELEQATDNLISNMNKVIHNPDLLKADPDGFKFGIDVLHGARAAAFGDPDAVGKSYTQDDSFVNYYDFESKGWRKFRRDSLLIVY